MMDLGDDGGYDVADEGRNNDTLGLIMKTRISEVTMVTLMMMMMITFIMGNDNSREE